MALIRSQSTITNCQQRARNDQFVLMEVIKGRYIPLFILQVTYFTGVTIEIRGYFIFQHD